MDPDTVAFQLPGNRSFIIIVDSLRCGNNDFVQFNVRNQL